MVELYALIVKSSPKYIKLKKIKLQKTTYRMIHVFILYPKTDKNYLCLCVPMQEHKRDWKDAH